MVRSITLSVSAPPVAPTPMLATTAASPPGVTSMPYGLRFAARSRLVFSTLVPSIDNTEMRLSKLRVTSAVRPSRVKTTPLSRLSGVPTSTFPAAVTVLPAIVKTETVPSNRLATSAMVPARLIDTPDAPLPARSVVSTAGGDALRSITVTLSSGAVLVASAGSSLVEEVTNARAPSGESATFWGGPTIELGTGSSARIRG